MFKKLRDPDTYKNLFDRRPRPPAPTTVEHFDDLNNIQTPKSSSAPNFDHQTLFDEHTHQETEEHAVEQIANELPTTIPKSKWAEFIEKATSLLHTNVTFYKASETADYASYLCVCKGSLNKTICFIEINNKIYIAVCNETNINSSNTAEKISYDEFSKKIKKEKRFIKFTRNYNNLEDFDDQVVKNLVDETDLNSIDQEELDVTKYDNLVRLFNLLHSSITHRNLIITFTSVIIFSVLFAVLVKKYSKKPQVKAVSKSIATTKSKSKKSKSKKN